MIGVSAVCILQNIKGHEDLLELNPQQQDQLCDEIRSFLVESVSKTGGHLASNLGMVELSVAIETVYNTQLDRLVFDVGHQSYVHKLLTGRQADFAHLRQFGGIAGFPKPSESKTDAFVAGHASSSVSIALGMARARTLQGDDYQVVAVIGDGAATGGMAYEALNDLAVSREPMVVILNDNEMSIAKNVGGMAKHLSRLRSKTSYIGMKQRVRKVLSGSKVGRGVYRASRSIKEWVKKRLIQPTIFENMGLSYIGPVDGHDVQGLISLLQLAKDMHRPVLIHVHTQKGRGYAPAESDPAKYHGVGKFDPKNGADTVVKPTFSQTFGQTMLELAAENPKVCAITAAMPDGTGLLDFMRSYPKRIFDVGIAEEHAVSMAGGLAKQGMVPVVALYSTFLQRSFDQILQDIAMLKLHVVLAVDRCGLVGEDGETHHGVFDTGFLRLAPGIKVLCPASRAELREMLRWAVNDYDGPVAIRYPRGGDGAYTRSAWDATSCVATHRNGSDCAIITYGTMINQALKAADLLSGNGVEASVIGLQQIAPLPLCALRDAVFGMRHVIIAEEASSQAAVHDTLALFLRENCDVERVDCLDLGDEYVTHGDMASLYKHYHLDAASIADFILEVRKVEK